LVVTVLVSIAVLLPVFGSFVVLLTLAVFVWLPVVELGTVYATATVFTPPAAIVPNEHVKFVVLVVVSHVPVNGVTVPRV
jgi:hypothetical protein